MIVEPVSAGRLRGATLEYVDRPKGSGHPLTRRAPHALLIGGRADGSSRTSQGSEGAEGGLEAPAPPAPGRERPRPPGCPIPWVTMETKQRRKAMNPLTRILLAGARKLPRGSRYALGLLGTLDSQCRDLGVPLRFWPEREIRLDLRVPDCQEVFWNGCYDYQVAEDRIALELIQRGDVVYDVGANIGYTALIYSHAAGPEGRVHAFEPGKAALRLLRRNVTGSDPVEIVPKAVGAAPGEVRFEEHTSINRSSVAGFGTPGSWDRKPRRTYTVEVITLDAYRRETGGPAPAFVKIDAEGYEVQVLLGMRGLLREAAPILMFEAALPVELERNVATIEDAVPGAYGFARVAHDASLVPLDRAEGATNNYIAMPRHASERFTGLAQLD